MRQTADIETSEAPSILDVYRSPEWIADWLGVHYRTVLDWIRLGELAALALGKNGSKPYRVAEADLQAFLVSRRTSQMPAAPDDRDELPAPTELPSRGPAKPHAQRRRKPGQLVTA